MSSCGGPPLVQDSFFEDEADNDDWERIYSKLNRDLKQQQEVTERKVEEYIFNGVRVNFPYVAYKSQKQLMSKAVEGVGKGQNCLLESPTGTGKTAALLCALLGWQEYCRMNNFTGRRFAEKASETAGNCRCGFMLNPEKFVGNPYIEDYSYGKKFRLCVRLNEDEDGIPLGVGCGGPAAIEGGLGSPSKIMKREPKPAKIRKKEKDDLCRFCLMSNFFRHTIPKIIYTTRTHSQVQQVVDQLKGTPYRNAKMTILASRKMTCINDQVVDSAKAYEARFAKGKITSSPKRGAAVAQNPGPLLNSSGIVLDENDTPKTLDEICSRLRRNYFKREKQKRSEETGGSTGRNAKEIEAKPVCKFFKPNSKNTFRDLTLKGAFDIEELKSEGQNCNACPYYGSFSLYKEADIVFCPYNYVISEDIRDAVEIELTGNIVVFDEAHNLEDICRDEASTNVIDLNRLDGHIRRDLDEALRKSGGLKTTKKDAGEYFSVLLQRLSTWMRNTAPPFPERNFYNPSSSPTDGPQHIVFKDKNMIKAFEELGFGEENLHKHCEHLGADVDKDDISLSTLDDSTTSSEEFKFKVPLAVSKFIKKLLKTLGYVYQDENYQHYNAVLVNNGEDLKPFAKESNSNSHTPLVSRRQYNISFEIICLSPAVAFKAIREQCHSIIVTSGTLSPLNSFAGELQTPFQVKLVADHVVGPHQTFSSCIKSGLNKKFELNSYGQKDVEIQDDLGRTILQICQTVPHGVLIFLPSYTLMETLRERWFKISSPGQEMSTLKQLEFYKHVFFEERKDKDVFEKDMEKYKQLINNPVKNSSQTGCLLFAVFRGKVSEGINFTDDQARAVVTVGIPFSNFGSHTVKYKREYNDERIRLQNNSDPSCTSSGNTDLLSGNEWYQIQAFRAMNQAFGRCVRHKNDWGAIIMLEFRMCLKHNKDMLSKWVKAELLVFGNFCEMKSRLHYFIQNRVAPVIPSTSRTILCNKEKDLDTSIVSLDMDVSCDDESSQTNHTQLTQVTSKLKVSMNSIGLAASKKNSSRSKSGEAEDLDSSSYSLDESDCFDVQIRNPPIISIHDLPTQVIPPQDISEDEISYHSPSSASSNDIMGGTP